MNYYIKPYYLIIILIFSFTYAKAQVNNSYIQIQVNLDDKSDSLIIGFRISKLVEEINKKSKMYSSDSIILNELLSFHYPDTIQYVSDLSFSFLYCNSDSIPYIESVDECIYRIIRKGDARMFWISSGKEITNIKTKKRMIRDKRGKRYSKILEYKDRDTGKYFLHELLVYYAEF